MKRKPSYISGILFLLLFPSMLLISCIESINDQISGTGQNKREEGYFSISLDTYASAALRAEIEEIEPWEYRVNQVWILLYNEKDTLDYKFVLDIQNYRNGNTALQNFFNKDAEVILENKSGTNKFQTAAQLVEKKAYKMAVLANPPATLFGTLSIEVGTLLSDLTNALDGRNIELTTQMFGGYENQANTPLFL